MNAVICREKRASHELRASVRGSRVQQDNARARFAGQRSVRVCLNTHVCGVLRAEEPRLMPQLAIRRRVDPDLWPIRGDDERIGELVLALALNAVDAIENDGRVTFETRNLVLAEGCITRATGLSPGPYVLLTVEDTGRGMDAHTLSQVFEPAASGAFTPSRPVLAGVLRITRLHQGHVGASSIPGVGTTVRVYLPAYLYDSEG